MYTVPTTPNPTSGYTLMVPKNKVVELDISVDQVLKYVISMVWFLHITNHNLSVFKREFR